MALQFQVNASSSTGSGQGSMQALQSAQAATSKFTQNQIYHDNSAVSTLSQLIASNVPMQNGKPVIEPNNLTEKKLAIVDYLLFQQHAHFTSLSDVQNAAQSLLGLTDGEDNLLFQNNVSFNFTPNGFGSNGLGTQQAGQINLNSQVFDSGNYSNAQLQIVAQHEETHAADYFLGLAKGYNDLASQNDPLLSKLFNGALQNDLVHAPQGLVWDHTPFDPAGVYPYPGNTTEPGSAEIAAEIGRTFTDSNKQNLLLMYQQDPRAFVAGLVLLYEANQAGNRLAGVTTG